MHDFTVLVLDNAYASGVAVTLDVLATAARLAPRLRLPVPTWRVLSPSGPAPVLSNGLTLPAVALPRRHRPDGSTWIVPGLGLDTPDAITARLTDDDAQQALRALAAHAKTGGRIAAACSAVFLLQAAGLLGGHRVTTTWWLAAELQRREPACTVDADRMVCTSGTLTTAGAAFAQTDLMLHLLRTRYGAAMADAVGRLLLIDARQAQSPFVVPALLSGGDELVGRLVARIEAALPAPPSVAELANAFAMSPRTLLRHVREATGGSVMALVHSVRLNRARRLLESSRMTVERVAEAVGYGDATALRRLMRKRTGAAPGRFRPAELAP